MGIFFRSTALVPTLTTALQNALTQNPATVPNPQQTAANMASQVQQQVTGQFSWGRLAVAIVLLMAVFAGCIYTAYDDKLVDLYKLLLHAFELLLGAVID